MNSEMTVALRKTKFSRADLKWIAAVSMILDHIACIFVSQQMFPLFYNILRLFGRISFPIICFLLVQGFRYTSNKQRYLVRLLAWALIAEIPFDLAFYGKLVHLGAQNVLFTLVLGLVVISMIHQLPGQEKYFVGKTLLVTFAGMILAGLLKVDYSYWGILTIVAFYLGQFQTKKRRRWLVIFICAMQGLFQLFAATALFFTENYNPDKKGKIPNNFFYWFYPAHLLILWVVSLG